MKNLLLLLALLLFIASAPAQDLTRDDYARAASFLSGNLFNKKIFNSNLQYNWFPDSSGCSFLLQDQQGKMFRKISFKTMKPEPLFDHARLAQLLSDTLHQSFNASNLPISSVQYTDKTHLLLNVQGRSFVLDLNNFQLTAKPSRSFNDSTSLSPDGKWLAFAQDHNLFIKSVATGTVQQLSHAGTKDYEYATNYGWGEIIEGENGQRPPHFFVSWSPDSKWIATYITDFRKGQKMYLLDWSIDTLYKPKLLSYYRGSPGDTDMVYLTPVFFNIESGEELRKDEFRNVNAAGYEWGKEPSVVYIENRKRGYQQVDLYRCSLNTNKTDTLYSETSKTNIDNYQSQLLPAGDKIIITSEKDGWKQLYLLSLRDKKLSPITNGAYYVNDLLYVDKNAKFLVFTASGKEPDRNPYFQHAYRINMDGSGLKLLTPENANHDITVSPDGKYMTDNISSYNLATRSVLRDTKTGKIITELALADIDPLLAMHFRFPEAFTCTARDGKTTIYGMIWKPTNFDPDKKYPIIDQSYTGPHTFMFPRNFVSAVGRSNQALAELGFIVVAVDGMGTANRSKAFHDV
ncbi:MAG TPA: DPP IV N-terminal domain-containing protein, partial [Chitinophagaceae bacterium]|nr:DPP IV N-terminal domain-containing protein [Chitinophagaceae bacterium]